MVHIRIFRALKLETQETHRGKERKLVLEMGGRFEHVMQDLGTVNIDLRRHVRGKGRTMVIHIRYAYTDCPSSNRDKNKTEPSQYGPCIRSP